MEINLDFDRIVVRVLKVLSCSILITFKSVIICLRGYAETR